MAKITLNYDEAHNFVEKNRYNGFYWDNYTIIKFSPHKAAYTDKNGIFRNNKWGFANRYNLKEDGTWDISDKYARFI